MLPTDKDASSAQSKLYDTNFKRWMKRQASNILPTFVPGVQYKRTINMKVIPFILYPDQGSQDEDEPHTILHTDMVFQVEYEGEPCIMYIEFQKEDEQDLSARLLACHALLHWEYQYPVITLVMCPFKMATAALPLVMHSGDQEILRFDYQTFRLFEMEAQPWVEQRQVWMYPFVAAMRGVHADLLTQVLTQLSEEQMYYSYQSRLDFLDFMRLEWQGDQLEGQVAEKLTVVLESQDAGAADPQSFLDLLAWMKSLLERNENLDEGERRKIGERFIPFEQSWVKRPSYQKMGEVYYKKEWEKGKAKGLTYGSEELVHLVKGRFPALLRLAKARAKKGESLEVLDALIEQLWAATDEQAARTLLETYPAS